MTSPSEKPTSSSLSEPNTRQAALDYADSLTKTLTLDKLLVHATEAKRESESLHHDLQASTRDYYSKLQSAITAAQNARFVANQVLTSSNKSDTPLQNIRKCANRSTSITNRLQPSRAKLVALDGIRVVRLLYTAAQLLITQIPSLYAELALCTDPNSTCDSILLAARRYDAVRPAIAHLANSDPDFADVYTKLQTVVKQVNEGLREEKGDVLSIVDYSRVRLLLGEKVDSLREEFFTNASNDLSNLRPPQAALTGSPCQKASIYVLYAIDIVLPKLHEIADGYEVVFRPQGDNDWTGFLLWAADVSDESFAAHVRQELAKGVLSDQKSVENLESAIEKLRKQSVNNRHIARLIGGIGEGLQATLVEAAKVEREIVVKNIVDRALSGDVVSGEEVMQSANEFCEKGEWFGLEWSLADTLDELGEYALASGLRVDNKTFGQTALLCRLVGKAAGDLGKGLINVDKVLTERLLRNVCEQVDDLLTDRITEVCSFIGADDARHSGKEIIANLLQLLQEAQGIGQACEIESLKGGGADELLNDDEQVGRCVGRLFVHRIREVVLDEGAIRDLQIDAWKISQCVGVDCFDDVSVAAVERCRDNGTALEREQIIALC